MAETNKEISRRFVERISAEFRRRYAEQVRLAIQERRESIADPETDREDAVSSPQRTGPITMRSASPPLVQLGYRRP